MESSFASRYGEIVVCSAFVIAGGVDSEVLEQPPKAEIIDKPKNVLSKVDFMLFCILIFSSTVGR